MKIFKSKSLVPGYKIPTTDYADVDKDKTYIAMPLKYVGLKDYISHNNKVIVIKDKPYLWTRAFQDKFGRQANTLAYWEWDGGIDPWSV